MNLKNLTDQTLIQKTEIYVREEREILTNLLHHFREIERRRLFCEYQYGSLHKMLVSHFGYSDDEAYRRTSAMRLLGELPEVEEQINRGELSLSHLGLAHSFFKQEQKSLQVNLPRESKLEILKKISAQPIREAQKTVYSLSSSPEQLRPDKVTVVSEDKIEFRFTADSNLEAKIRDLKGLLAHQNPNISMAELFQVLCDLGLQEFKKAKVPQLRVKTQISAPSMKPSVTKSFKQIKREVWNEGQHKCSNCQSTYALEVDHRYPKAKGGENTKDNLRILCRSCNQRAAIQHFGISKMDPFLNRHRVAIEAKWNQN